MNTCHMHAWDSTAAGVTGNSEPSNVCAGTSVRVLNALDYKKNLSNSNTEIMNIGHPAFFLHECWEIRPRSSWFIPSTLLMESPPAPFPQQRFLNDWQFISGNLLPKIPWEFLRKIHTLYSCYTVGCSSCSASLRFPQFVSFMLISNNAPRLQDYCEPSLHGILNPVHRPFQNICLMFPQILESDLKCQAHFLRNPHRRQNIVLNNVYGLLADPPTNNHPKEWRTFSPHLDTRRTSLW